MYTRAILTAFLASHIAHAAILPNVVTVTTLVPPTVGDGSNPSNVATPVPAGATVVNLSSLLNAPAPHMTEPPFLHPTVTVTVTRLSPVFVTVTDCPYWT
jgi:hypothetical protein